MIQIVSKAQPFVEVVLQIREVKLNVGEIVE